MNEKRRLPSYSPPGRHWRTWRHTGGIALSWARRYPLALPIRLAWVTGDRLAWWWWWYGWGEEGIGHFAWYRRADDLFARGYWWLYSRLIVIIQREIGD